MPWCLGGLTFRAWMRETLVVLHYYGFSGGSRSKYKRKQVPMIYGAHVKSVEDIDLLIHMGFAMGEVVLKNTETCGFWLGTGVKNDFGSRFSIIAHGPREGPPNDVSNLWDRYMPALEDTILTCEKMEIHYLTIHLWMDARFVRPDMLEQKTAALGDIVTFGKSRGVTVGLENLSETVNDFSRALEAVPELVITLDVGHGQLLTEVNTSFDIISQLGASIAHIHVHDNHGGNGVNDDLHLPIGNGVIDYNRILNALVGIGFDGTITFEVEKDHLVRSLEKVKRIVDNARHS
jgi:sugar phosphate isomerase/epimerase